MLHCRTHPTTSWERLNSWDSGGVFWGTARAVCQPFSEPVHPFTVPFQRAAVTRDMEADAHGSSQQPHAGPGWTLGDPRAWSLGPGASKPASQRASSCPAGLGVPSKAH